MASSDDEANRQPPIVAAPCGAAASPVIPRSKLPAQPLKRPVYSRLAFTALNVDERAEQEELIRE
eukprot:scaffold243086_cov15-Prasinocladus_malaysianus.AAC.1